MAVRAPIDLHVDYITMICIQCCLLNIIHYAAFNDTAEYTLLHAPKSALKMFLSTHLIEFHSITHSEPALLYAPRLALKKRPSTLQACSQVYLQGSVLNRPVRQPGTAVLSEILPGRTGQRPDRPSCPGIWMTAGRLTSTVPNRHWAVTEYRVLHSPCDVAQ
jgi:hypothetical protein